MPLTRPIPRSAKFVAARLRAEVKKWPAAKKWTPEHSYSASVLRCTDGKCPMGLHPSATEETPTELRDFEDRKGWGGERGIQAFYDWWDEQTDARAALRAIKEFE